MGMNAAQQFVNQVSKDAVLGQQLVGSSNNMGAMMKVAQEAGFVFSTEEFMAALAWQWIMAGEKLNEVDLHTVGGKGPLGYNTKSAAGACYTLGNGPDCRI